MAVSLDAHFRQIHHPRVSARRRHLLSDKLIASIQDSWAKAVLKGARNIVQVIAEHNQNRDLQKASPAAARLSVVVHPISMDTTMPLTPAGLIIATPLLERSRTSGMADQNRAMQLNS